MLPRRVASLGALGIPWDQISQWLRTLIHALGLTVEAALGSSTIGHVIGHVPQVVRCYGGLIAVYRAWLHGKHKSIVGADSTGEFHRGLSFCGAACADIIVPALGHLPLDLLHYTEAAHRLVEAFILAQLRRIL